MAQPGTHHCFIYGCTSSHTDIFFQPCTCLDSRESKYHNRDMSSRSKYTLPCSPLTSNVFAFLRPLAKRVASKWPIAPLAYWHTKMEGSSISILALPPSGRSRSLTKIRL